MSQEYQKVKVTEISLDKPMPVNIFVPKSKILEKIRELALKKVQQTLLQAILLGIFGGFYQCTSGQFKIILLIGIVHFCVRAIYGLDIPHVNENSEQIKVTKLGSGVLMAIYSGLFPIGMLLILINGGDIFLMELFYFVIAMFQKAIDIKKAVLKLAIVFMTNWIAAIFYTWLLMYETKLFEGSNYQAGIKSLTSKYLDFKFFQTLLLGVGGGIVISFAFMMNIAGKSAMCRIVSIWAIIGLYPILFFQHYQDTFPLFSITLWYDGPFSVGDYIGKSLIPVFIGNVIGVLMIAVGYAITEDQEEKIGQFLTPIKDHDGIQDEVITKN